MGISNEYGVETGVHRAQDSIRPQYAHGRIFAMEVAWICGESYARVS